MAFCFRVMKCAALLCLLGLGFSGAGVAHAVTEAEASRFLAQASWGPTWETIAEVKLIGLETWIERQMSEKEQFREEGQLMEYRWLDGTRPGLRWQNVWFEWDDQNEEPAPKLVPTDLRSFAELDRRWPGYQGKVPKIDPHERGPFLAKDFPKRGIEPYVFYLHWRKVVLDRPIWQTQLTPPVQWTEPYHATPAWPYHLTEAYYRTSNPGYAGAVESTCRSVAMEAGADEAWLRRALYDTDQLRQRTTWALSQILVVSDIQGAAGVPGIPALGNYYDLLSLHAFGNFTELLTAVTFHPLMASWLTYVDNEKAKLAKDGVTELRLPDENYAREILQLFSIGLEELNIDGTPKLDAKGQRIPTYTQEDVRQLSRVFTGLRYRTRNLPGVTLPLKMDPALHETREKRFLGLHLPALSDQPTAAICEAEVRAAVAHIAKHPNVAPFISKLLIQHLVTSNPTPDYVRRVATVFQTHSESPKQLAEVVKAILMDAEARTAESPTSGRVKDPMLRLMSLMRAFHAGREYSGGRYDLRSATQHPLDGPPWGWGHLVRSDSSHPFNDLLQTPFTAPSVFSFFLPGYAQPGLIVNAGMLSPELQLASASTMTATVGRVWTDTAHTASSPLESLGFNSTQATAEPKKWLANLYRKPTVRPRGSTLDLRGKALRLHFEKRTQLQSTDETEVNAFLDKLNVLLCHGRLSASTRAHLFALLRGKADPTYMESTDAWHRERAAVQLLWAMPDAAVLR